MDSLSSPFYRPTPHFHHRSGYFLPFPSGFLAPLPSFFPDFLPSFLPLPVSYTHLTLPTNREV